MNLPSLQTGSKELFQRPPFPPEYPPMHSALPPNFPVPVNSNPMLNPPMPFSYPHYMHEGAQPFHVAPYDMPRQDPASEIGANQGSLLGFPLGPASGASFPANYPQPWNAGITGMPFELVVGPMSLDPRDGKGMLTPQPMPLPPSPPNMSHLKQKYYSGELGGDGLGYGWQHDNHDIFGSG